MDHFMQKLKKGNIQGYMNALNKLQMGATEGVLFTVSFTIKGIFL